MTRDERDDLKGVLIEALNSKEGQEAIKNGALKALKSEEGKEVFSELFVDNFKEVVVPAFENHEDRIIALENQQLAA